MDPGQLGEFIATGAEKMEVVLEESKWSLQVAPKNLRWPTICTGRSRSVIGKPFQAKTSNNKRLLLLKMPVICSYSQE